MSALDLLAGLILADGRAWGEAATDWQRDDAAAVLGDDGPRLHFLTRPRGASKTTDTAGVALAALVEQFPPGARGYTLAVDADQAGLLVEAAAGLVARSGLSGLVEVQTRRIVNRQTDAAITVLAADAASAWGILPWWVSVDELAQWPTGHQALWEAVLTSVPKVAGCRLVVLTTAGDPAHWSHRLLLRARASSAWRTSEVGGPCPWIAPAALDEQRALLTDALYRRYHLNEWVAAEDRLASVEQLAAAVTLDGPQDPRRGLRYTVGCDIGLRHDRTAIAVCHAERVKGRPKARSVVLDRLVVFAGTREREVELRDVEAALLEIHRTFGHPNVRLDPWQGIGLAQRLRAQGVRVEEFSYTNQRYAQAAQTLFTLLRDGLLALYPDAELLDELANLRLRETSPGMLRVDHDPGRHDDRAVALGFAAVPLVEKGSRGRLRSATAADVMLDDSALRVPTFGGGDQPLGYEGGGPR